MASRIMKDVQIEGLKFQNSWEPYGGNVIKKKII